MDLSRINLNLLLALHQLLDKRSVTGAAQALHLTQPAVSRSLSQLRELFADPLLVRVGNRMQLTPRAEELQSQLGPVLHQLEHFFTPGQFDPASFRGHFHIAVTDYLAEHILPPVVGALNRQVPGLQLHFHLWEPAMVRDLREGRLDLAACVLDTVPNDIHGREVGVDNYTCVLRNDHPLAGSDLDLDTYIGANHIAISGGGDKNRAVDEALAQQGLHRRIAVSVPFIQAALAFTARSDALLTLPLHMAQALAPGYDLVQRPLPLTVPPLRYFLLWPRRAQQDPALRFLREQLFVALLGSKLAD